MSSDWDEEPPKKPKKRRGGKKPSTVLGDNIDATGLPTLWAYLKREAPLVGLAALIVGVGGGISIWKSGRTGQ